MEQIKLNLQLRKNIIANNINESFEKALPPVEGEVRKYKDGDYKFTNGKWKKLKQEENKQEENKKVGEEVSKEKIESSKTENSSKTTSFQDKVKNLKSTIDTLINEWSTYGSQNRLEKTEYKNGILTFYGKELLDDDAPGNIDTDKLVEDVASSLGEEYLKKDSEDSYILKDYLDINTGDKGEGGSISIKIKDYLDEIKKDPKSKEREKKKEEEKKREEEQNKHYKENYEKFYNKFKEDKENQQLIKNLNLSPEKEKILNDYFEKNKKDFYTYPENSKKNFGKAKLFALEAEQKVKKLLNLGEDTLVAVENLGKKGARIYFNLDKPDEKVGYNKKYLNIRRFGTHSHIVDNGFMLDITFIKDNRIYFEPRAKEEDLENKTPKMISKFNELNKKIEENKDKLQEISLQFGNNVNDLDVIDVNSQLGNGLAQSIPSHLSDEELIQYYNK